MSNTFVKLPISVRPLLRELKAHDAFVVYAYLLLRRNWETGQCNPKVETILSDLDLDPRTWRKAKAALEKAGLLTIDGRNFILHDLANSAFDARTQNARTSNAHAFHAPSTVHQMHSEIVHQMHLRSRCIEEDVLEGDRRAAPVGSPAACSADQAAVSSPQAAEVPQAQSAPKRTAKAEKDRAARPALTDEKMRAITSDVSGVSLAAYLLHGAAAVGLPPEQWHTLPRSSTCWASQSASRPEPDAKHPALAGYIAFKTAEARVADGQPIKVPDLRKLFGVVKTLRGRMTQDELVGHVERIAANWPRIKAALSWMTTPPPLDEVLLFNPKVMEQSDLLARGQSLAPAQAPAASVPVCPGMTAEQSAAFVKELESRMNKVPF